MNLVLLGLIAVVFVGVIIYRKGRVHWPTTIGLVAAGLLTAWLTDVEDFPVGLTTLTILLRSLGMVFAVAFLLRYLRLNWQATPEGRHLIGFTLIVALFLGYATANNIAMWLDPASSRGIRGNWPGRSEVGAVLYGLVAWFLFQRNRLLTLAQRERREMEAEE